MLGQTAGAPRLAFVVDGPLDQPTGGYLYDRRVIEGLRARGAVVDVVNLDPEALLSAPRENARLLRLLHQDKPAYDAVILDELCHPRAVIAALLRPRRGPALVTLLHHVAASERRGARAVARLFVERALLSASDRVVVTSETTAKVALAAGAPSGRVVVVRPGRDRLGQTLAPPARLPGAPARLLFLGALTPRKDPLVLLDAFAAVADRATLTLAGPADRDARCAAEVLTAASRYGRRVRVTGAVTDDELRALFASHDVFVLPSRYEGFGIAVAEAASFGLAIVSCRAGAIPEVVRDQEDALLVPPGDARALALALDALVSDPAKLEAMQRAALARARSLPTWAEAEDAFGRALADVLGSRASDRDESEKRAGLPF